jgi:peptidoglycan hydrolase CwlO-like protein
VAQEKTLQGLKIDDPKLYEKLQKNPAKDLQDLDSAVIGEMMKEAPKTKPEVKKTKETIEKVGDEIYRK